MQNRILIAAGYMCVVESETCGKGLICFAWGHCAESDCVTGAIKQSLILITGVP